jgi:betaine-aldehyde dehydrogenase
MKRQQILVGGQWAEAASRRSFDVRSPATLELLGRAPDCGTKDVDRAVAAARAAQRGWRRLPGVEKAKLLRRTGARIRGRGRELARLMVRETGKPLVEAADCVEWVAAVFEYYAEVARSSYGNSVPPASPHQLNFTIKEPYGVVAAIVPFNFPLLLMAWKVAPALAAGNAVVCKPPSLSPLSSLLLGRCYDALPPGVVNIITGGGGLLARHPGVDLVAFTGSTETGRRIAAQAGRDLKKVNLELGGIDPLIVFPDADLEVAVRGAAWARLLNAGQVCTSAKRVILVEPIAEEFTRRLVEHVRSLRVGDPMRRDTDIGPLISAAAAAEVERQVARAVRQGARLLLGGRRFRPKGLKGHFFEPTVLSGVRPGSLPCTEEIFGPVLALMTAESPDEAIAMADDSEYGLGASVYTRSLDLAMRAATEIKAGTFWINDPLTDNDAAPFGGMRRSGIGRELGAEGLDAFREPKHVHLDYAMEAKPFWYPYKDRELPSYE